MTDLRDDIRRVRFAFDPPPDAFERLVRRRERHRIRQRVAAGVVALLVALAGIGGALWALGRGTEGDLPERRPAAGLDLTAGPGQYYYERTVTFELAPTSDDPSFRFVRREGSEIWWARDGSGRSRSLLLGIDFFRPEDRERYLEEVGPIDIGKAKEETWEPGSYPHENDVSSLSLDPDDLYGQLVDRSAPGGASPQPRVTPGPGQDPSTGGVWRAINALFADDRSARWEAALVGVAMRLPSAVIEEGILDPVGRPAIALRITTERIEHTWYLEPDSLQLLARIERPEFLGTPWFVSIKVADGIVESTEDGAPFVERFVPAPVTPVSDLQPIPDPRD